MAQALLLPALRQVPLTEDACGFQEPGLRTGPRGWDVSGLSSLWPLDLGALGGSGPGCLPWSKAMRRLRLGWCSAGFPVPRFPGSGWRRSGSVSQRWGTWAPSIPSSSSLPSDPACPHPGFFVPHQVLVGTACFWLDFSSIGVTVCPSRSRVKLPEVCSSVQVTAQALLPGEQVVAASHHLQLCSRQLCAVLSPCFCSCLGRRQWGPPLAPTLRGCSGLFAVKILLTMKPGRALPSGTLSPQQVARGPAQRWVRGALWPPLCDGCVEGERGWSLCPACSWWASSDLLSSFGCQRGAA